MSQVLIVYAHPEPTSFTGAMKDTAVRALQGAGHSVTVSDLHGEKFDPVAGRHDFTGVADASRFHYQTEQTRAARDHGFAPDIVREQGRLAAADFLLMLYPMWWAGPPAILKGWIDRVLAWGFAYGDGRRFATGVFQGRRAMIGVTTGATAARYSDGGVFADINTVLLPIQKLTLGYLGYEVEEPFMAWSTPRVTQAERTAYLDDFTRRIIAAAAKPVDRRPLPSALQPPDTDPWSVPG